MTTGREETTMFTSILKRSLIMTLAVSGLLGAAAATAEAQPRPIPEREGRTFPEREDRSREGRFGTRPLPRALERESLRRDFRGFTASCFLPRFRTTAFFSPARNNWFFFNARFNRFLPISRINVFPPTTGITPTLVAATGPAPALPPGATALPPDAAVVPPVGTPPPAAVPPVPATPVNSPDAKPAGASKPAANDDK
jgi:hypothetical protein